MARSEHQTWQDQNIQHGQIRISNMARSEHLTWQDWNIQWTPSMIIIRTSTELITCWVFSTSHVKHGLLRIPNMIRLEDSQNTNMTSQSEQSTRSNYQNIQHGQPQHPPRLDQNNCTACKMDRSECLMSSKHTDVCVCLVLFVCWLLNVPATC